jgi:hypothetical protein
VEWGAGYLMTQYQPKLFTSIKRYEKTTVFGALEGTGEEMIMHCFTDIILDFNPRDYRKP